MSKNINTNKNNINIKILMEKIRKTEKKIKKGGGGGGQAPPAPVQQVVVQAPPPPPQFYRVAMPNYGNRPYLQDQEQTPQELQSNYDSFDAERQALVQSYLEQAQNIAGVPEDTSAGVAPSAIQEVATLPEATQEAPVEVAPTPEPVAPPPPETQPVEEPVAPPPEIQPETTPPQVQEVQNLMEQMTTTPNNYLMSLLTRPLTQLISSRDVVQSLQRLGFEPISVERRGQTRIQIKNPLTGRNYFIDTKGGKDVIQERRLDILSGVYQV